MLSFVYIVFIKFIMSKRSKLYKYKFNSNRKHVFEVPMAFCMSQERNPAGADEGSCPTSCEKEKERLTCGSDGNVYRSECEMNMLNCG